MLFSTIIIDFFICSVNRFLTHDVQKEILGICDLHGVTGRAREPGWIARGWEGYGRGGGGQEKIMTGRELEILRKSGIRRNGEINRQCLIFRNPKRGLREEAKKVVAGTGMDSYPMPSNFPPHPSEFLQFLMRRKEPLLRWPKFPNSRHPDRKIVSETILFFWLCGKFGRWVPLKSGTRL